MQVIYPSPTRPPGDKLRLTFVYDTQWFGTPGDFSVIVSSALELFSVLMEANPLFRHVYKVIPQPGAPESWPHGQAWMPTAWVPRSPDDETLERFSLALWEKASLQQWGDDADFTGLSNLVHAYERDMT